METIVANEIIRATLDYNWITIIVSDIYDIIIDNDLLCINYSQV